MPVVQERAIRAARADLDDLQGRAIASGARAVADYGPPLGLHRQIRACKKALFYWGFSKLLYGGGEGGTLPRGCEKAR
jgi:hypothetical protein